MSRLTLNSTQRLAVDTIDGPVMVIAGPGTGKTEIIAQRVARILKTTDTPPDAILALTFTESGAKEMRQRLLGVIGQTAYYVNIFTFHAFCSSVIQEFPDHFIISPEIEPLSDLERVEIFHQILKDTQLEALKPVNQPYYYTLSLIKSIQDLKREGVSSTKLRSLIKKGDRKNQELLKVYRLYQKHLQQRGRYDFEDMINLVVKAFQTEADLLRTYQERLHYFLVDEYQDTNSAQNKVLGLLASYWGEEANIFVVCDPDQSIYRFQGASLENLIGFTQTYPQATLISLNQNYRSTQTILDSAYDLIQHNHWQTKAVIKGISSKLKAKKKYPERKLKLVCLPSETIENFSVAKSVKALIDRGVAAEKIAVIFRHNADALDLVEMFAKLDIPVDIEGGGNILEDPAIQKLLTLFKVIHLSPKNLEDLDLFTLWHYPFLEFNPLDVLKLARYASAKRINFINLILFDSFKELDLKEPQAFIDFVQQLSLWQQLDAEKTFSRFFESVLKQSGFLDWILSQPDATAHLNRLNSLFSEIKRLNRANHRLNLNSFIEALELMEINHLSINEEDLDIKTNSVTLTTAHKAKGKEWDYVFIIKAIDGKWGNNRTRELIKLPEAILKNTDFSKKEKNEDERRLFYVALTRAKKEVFISFAERYSGDGHVKEALPTMFLSEIPDRFKLSLSSKKIVAQAKKILSQLLAPAVQVSPVSVKEKQFLKTILTEFKLSPTGLNTYLQCPYKFKLNNLFRIPRAKEPYLSFGTAVHRALDLFYRQFIENDKYPSKEFLLDQFEKALKKEVLDPVNHKIRLRQGKRVLRRYYDYYRDDFVKPLFTEKYFGYGWSKVFLDDIPLSGKVDRIEPFSSEPDKKVRIVDYKTGSVQTRNEILGKTKSSDGDYYRQLVFYQLMVQLDRTFPFRVAETELDFVEPDKKTKRFKKERFKISAADLDALKKIIRRAMNKIRQFSFSRTDQYRHCRRCEYKLHCWPNGLPLKNSR
jgi:DNA helicase-2/ATP-dependent DNA helicase PcrA